MSRYLIFQPGLSPFCSCKLAIVSFSHESFQRLNHGGPGNESGFREQPLAVHYQYRRPSRTVNNHHTLQNAIRNLTTAISRRCVRRTGWYTYGETHLLQSDCIGKTFASIITIPWADSVVHHTLGSVAESCSAALKSALFRRGGNRYKSMFVVGCLGRAEPWVNAFVLSLSFSSWFPILFR